MYEKFYLTIKKSTMIESEWIHPQIIEISQITFEEHGWSAEAICTVESEGQQKTKIIRFDFGPEDNPLDFLAPKNDR